MALQKNWSQRAVWLPRLLRGEFALLDAVAGGDKPVGFAEGKAAHRWPPPFVHCSPTGAGDEFRRTGHKERVGDTVKVDVAEFAEADPERLALHQKAVALSKRRHQL